MAELSDDCDIDIERSSSHDDFWQYVYMLVHVATM
jgi:hypothetical protein